MNRPEPAVIAAAIKELISAIIKLAVVFSVIKMTTEQFGSLIIVIDSFMAILMVLVIRQNVTPVSAPRVEKGTKIEVTENGAVTSEKIA